MFLNDYLTPSFQNFVVPKYMDVPFTQIQNRAQIFDYSNMLMPLTGSEKRYFKSLAPIPNEYGPNGEPVFEIDTKDARFRFVGNSWSVISGANGTAISKLAGAATADSYLEVSYFGNALNLLMTLSGSGYNITQITDNGSSAAVLTAATFAAGAGGRNVPQNQVVSVVSGLALTQHTTKISFDTSSFFLYGVEIINLNADVTITAGQGFSSGEKLALNALTVSPYNAGLTGTKGARVTKYLKDGVVSQTVQEIPSTPLYLANATHANEEVVRRFNWREFGTARADDWSTLTTSSSNRAFTLDDGTTTLIGFGVAQDASNPDSLVVGISGYVVITFTGSGLDILNSFDGGGAALASVTIDGVVVGNWVRPAGTGIYKPSLFKICSGLPYGTHVVKLTGIVASSFGAFSDFIVYQPKKIAIPAKALEIASYNAMAPYVNSGLSLGISQGVIRKTCMREFTFSGTWNAPVLGTDIGFGVVVGCSTAGAWYEHTVIGYGFDLNQYHNTGTASTTVTVSVNGSSNLSAFTTQAYGPSLISFTPTTGALVMNATVGNNVVSVRGLPYGIYKVRVTFVSGGTTYANCIDTITTAHINDPSFRVSSCPLIDSTVSQALTVPVKGQDIGKAKAWLIMDQAANRIIASYNIAQTFNTLTGYTDVHFIKPFKSTNYSFSGSVNASVAASFLSDTSVVYPKTPSKVNVSTVGHDGTLRNEKTSIFFFGDLIDE